jgi:hypothetical protein
VRAEHAAAHVRLVDHDEREPEEEVRPARMIRQDREVQHVGVREDEVRVLPDQRPLGLRRVAVVGGRADLRELQRAHGAQLIPRQGLRGEQVDRGGLRDRDGGLGEREVVDERLAARGAGGQDHVAAGPQRLEPTFLVRIEAVDPEQPDPRDDELREVGRERGECRLSRRELARPHEAVGGVGVERGQLVEEPAGVHASDATDETPVAVHPRRRTATGLASPRVVATGADARPARARPVAAPRPAPRTTT